MHLVAHVIFSVPDEPAYVEAEGEEAGSQQVTQGSQVGDGEVVGVHASTPHPVDHPVCQVEEDNHLEQDKEEAYFHKQHKIKIYNPGWGQFMGKFTLS